MHIFYAPGVEGNTCTLDKNESNHCVRVLRMTKGSMVRLIDGTGNLYEGVISNPDSKKCTIAITNTIKDFEKRGYKLHVAISPLKNPERFEWFVEKSVEIGIDEITPLICRNSEKHTVNSRRVCSLIIAAMKQSLKAVATTLNNPCPFGSFVMKEHRGSLMIAHCNDAIGRNSISELYHRGDDAVIIIGPEGDFSEEEINIAINRGFRPLHLGRSRLRTETAGVAACYSICFMNQ